MKTKTLISIIIPAKNGISTIRQCLDAIFSQTLIDQTEVIIIDSGSTDGTIEALKQYPVRLYTISPQEFNHGTTRNYGASLAKGEIIVMTVQDAMPCDKHWLEKFATHFKNEQIQAVVGIQTVAHDADKNPALWFRRTSEPKTEIRYIPSGQFEALSPKEQFQLSNWDNVNAAYRRMALIEVPFAHTNYSEDWLWAKSALLKGFTIARDPSITTYHYHHHTFKYNFRVKSIGLFYHYHNFSYLPPFDFPLLGLFKKTKSIITTKEITVLKKIYWIHHNLNIFLSGVLANIIMRVGILVSPSKNTEWLYKLFFKNSIPQGTSNGKQK